MQIRRKIQVLQRNKEDANEIVTPYFNALLRFINNMVIKEERF